MSPAPIIVTISGKRVDVALTDELRRLALHADLAVCDQAADEIERAHAEIERLTADASALVSEARQSLARNLLRLACIAGFPPGLPGSPFVAFMDRLAMEGGGPSSASCSSGVSR